MKIKNSIFLTFLLSFLNLSFAETISITNGEWPPYLSQKVNYYGIGSHIVSESFKQFDVGVKWGFFPWNRSIKQAKKGQEWEAAALWLKTDEREKDFDFSDPVISIQWVFFYNKNNRFNWKSFKDLKKYKIGITQGYSYGKELDQLIKNKKLRVRSVNKDELNILKLGKSKIDIFPLSKLVGLAMIEKLKKKYPKNKGLSNLTFHSKPLHQQNLYLLFSKNRKNKLMLQKFNQGIKMIRKEGKYKKIMVDAANGYYSK